jgi:tryptophan synthase alpha chain
MSRIKTRLDALRAAGRKALIPYMTAGDPYADATPEIMHALAAGGADVIELGVPFSDPMADGPVIQKAGERALARGITLGKVLAMVRSFRRDDPTTPVVLMGYANPVERYGIEAFVADARDASLRAAGLDPIVQRAPTSTEARMAQVGRIASGYVYYVSLKGVTGAGHLDTEAVAAMLPRIRAFVPLPLGVGFGIRDAATAQAVARVADAVVIGSRLVQILENQPRESVAGAARGFMAEIRQALDAC